MPAVHNLFHIPVSGSEIKEPELSLIAGDTYAAFAITSNGGTELLELAYCITSSWDDDSFQFFFQQYPHLQLSFKKVTVAYDLENACVAPSLIPGDFFSQVLGNDACLLTEEIPGWQLRSGIGVPFFMKEMLDAKFPRAHYCSFFHLLLKTEGIPVNGPALVIDFKMNNLSLIALKNNRLLLAQQFEYQTPEDVCFYLLSLCRQFSLLQDQTPVIASGLMDKHSELYKMLYQYFSGLSFTEPGWHIPLPDTPSSYFTQLNILSRCV